MSSNVSMLPVQDDALKLDTLAEAARLYLHAREQQRFAFAPSLASTVGRCAQLLDSFRDKLIETAQGLDAQIQADPLGSIISVFSDNNAPALAEEVIKEVSSIASALKQQVDLIRRELDACESLPPLNAQADLQRLNDRQADIASQTAQVEKTSEQLATELTQVNDAIKTLEDQQLETKSGGLVPSEDQLAKLVGTGAKAQPVIAGIQAALQTLELVLGASVAGMSFKTLYSQAKELRARCNEEAAQARDLDRQVGVIASQIKTLETVPQLQTQLEAWKTVGKQLANVLSQHYMSLDGVQVNTAADISDLRARCNKLLALEERLVRQIVS